MSLRRWPVYVWSDGENMHLWACADAEAEGVSAIRTDDYPDFACGFSMPLMLWDEIVQTYIDKYRVGVGDET